MAVAATDESTDTAIEQDFHQEVLVGVMDVFMVVAVTVVKRTDHRYGSDGVDKIRYSRGLLLCC